MESTEYGILYRDYGFQPNFILLAGGCSFSSIRFSAISNKVVLSLLYSLKFSETALWSTLCEEMTFGEWIITVRYLYDMELCIEFWKKKDSERFFTEGEERATGVGENKVNTWEIDNISLTNCVMTFVINTASKLLRIDSYNFWIVSRGMSLTSARCWWRKLSSLQNCPQFDQIQVNWFEKTRADLGAQSVQV